MPPLNVPSPDQIRVLAQGRPKTYKTRWALEAAKAGFNIIDLDFDKGGAIGSLVPPEYRHLVHIIDIADFPKRAVGAVVLALILRGSRVVYDETEREICLANPKPTSAHYIFDLRKSTTNDIVVLDTWTSLTASLQLQVAIENKVDLSDAKKTDWDFYRYEGAFLNWVLNQMKAYPCHWIAIGHTTVYEKWRETVVGDRKVRELLDEREVIKSSSNPHALTIPGSFSDVLKFYKAKNGEFRITSKPTGNSDVGSRHFPGEIYHYEKFPFSELAKAAHVPLLGKDAPPTKAAVYYPPGELKSTREGFELTGDQPKKTVSLGSAPVAVQEIKPEVMPQAGETQPLTVKASGSGNPFAGFGAKK